MKTHDANKSAFGLAGWLFADLLLALSMIFLVANTRIPVEQADILPTSTPALNPTEAETTDETSLVEIEENIGLGDAQCYNVELRARGFDYTRVSNSLVDNLPNSIESQAGLVLVWTHGTSIQEGVFLSKAITRMVKEQFPLSFSDAKFKSLGFSSGQLYLVQIEIYFLTNSPWEGGEVSSCLYVN